MIRPAHRRVAELLKASVAWPVDPERVARAVNGVDLNSAVVAANHHRVGPLVHIALRDSTGISHPALAAEQRGQLFRYLRVMADIRGLGAALNSAGCRWLAFKGPVLATAYGRPDLRTYADLDVLVDRRHLSHALDVLDGLGARLVDTNWSMIDRDTRGELSLLLPNGTPLDLHWALVNDWTLRRELALPVDLMLDRRELVKLDGTSVPGFAGPDELVYVAMHAALSGGHRLLWLSDLDRLWRRLEAATGDAAGAVSAAAREAHLNVLVAVMLDRAHRVVGTPVPRSVRRSLGTPFGWRGVVSVVDRVRPPELSFAPGLTGRVVASASRGSSSASVRALSRGISRQLRRSRISWNVNPLHVVSDDPEARQAFLERVGNARHDP